MKNWAQFHECSKKFKKGKSLSFQDTVLNLVTYWGMEVGNKCKIFSTISPKFCQLGQNIIANIKRVFFSYSNSKMYLFLYSSGT